MHCLDLTPNSSELTHRASELQPKTSTSHFSPHTSHLTAHFSQSKFHITFHKKHTLHLTPETSYLTQCPSDFTPHTSHLTLPTSHLTPQTSHLSPQTWTSDFILRADVRNILKCAKGTGMTDHVRQQSSVPQPHHAFNCMISLQPLQNCIRSVSVFRHRLHLRWPSWHRITRRR